MKKMHMLLSVIFTGMIFCYLGFMIMLGRALQGMERIHNSQRTGLVIRKKVNFLFESTIPADNPSVLEGKMTKRNGLNALEFNAPGFIFSGMVRKRSTSHGH